MTNIKQKAKKHITFFIPELKRSIDFLLVKLEQDILNIYAGQARTLIANYILKDHPFHKAMEKNPKEITPAIHQLKKDLDKELGVRNKEVKKQKLWLIIWNEQIVMPYEDYVKMVGVGYVLLKDK